MSYQLRISQSQHEKLRFIAKQDGISIARVLVLAIDNLYREHFFDACERGFARLWSDPEMAAEERAERKVWDVTLSDGLDDC